MKIRFKPAPKPLFDPFNGFDEEEIALIEAKRAKKARCKPGTKRDPKSGKCAVRVQRK